MSNIIVFNTLWDDPLIALILIGVIALVGFAVYRDYKKRQEMKSGGYLLQRSGAYWKQTQVYTTSAKDFNALFESVKRFFPPGIEGRRSADGEYMMFQGREWEALLDHVGQEGNKEVYEFHFTEYTTSDGTVAASQQMDLALTAVEKAFLIEDPFTRYVTKETVGLKSRPQLF